VLWPYDGPPYHSINILLDSTASFDAGDTFQRSLQVTGLWGHSNVERPTGATAEALDSTETAVDVTDGSVIGVGDVLRVDAERVVVTERTWLDSGTTLDGDLTSSVGERTVTVADGTALTAGENILVGSETMRVTSVTGNDLTVRRAWDGSTNTTHSSGAAVYASRRLTVERGALGTTAATHLTGAALSAHVVPAPVRSEVDAEAMIELGLRQSRQAATSGTGDSAQDVSGGGMRPRDVGYRRRARFRSVGR
jgi:hypothetical protein